MIPTKTIVTWLVIVLVVATGLWWIDRTYLGGRFTSGNSETRALYKDTQVGLFLNYRQQPNGYVIIPRKSDTGTSMLLSLSLFRYADYQAQQAGSFGQEGPPSIAVQVFNNSKNSLPWDWVKANSQSNYQLSRDKKLSPGSIHDKPAVFYNWSGLYEGHSAAVLHNRRIYLFSVMSEPTDSMRRDFEDLLARVMLQ